MTSLAKSDDLRFSSPDDDDVAAYRPLSPWAVVALVLGLLAPLGLLGPLLWAIPLAVAVVAGGVWLRLRLRADRGGAGLALAGLTLGALFLGWGPAQTLLDRHFLTARARPAAEAWLDLVRQDRLWEAHQLTLPAAERFPPGVDLAARYAPPKETRGGADRMPTPAEALHQFFGRGPLHELSLAGPEASWEYEQCLLRDTYQGKDYVELRYRLKLPRVQGGELDELVDISLERGVAEGGQAEWRIVRANAPPPG